MNIALCLETSQASRVSLVKDILENVCSKFGHTLFNYGVKSEQDGYQITYTQMALLNSILINSKAVDFVVTGCATGMGAMIASNSFPGVYCGFIVDPIDAVLVKEINDVNAVSIPYQKGFGLGSEMNLKAMFEKLFNPDSEGYLNAEGIAACQAMKKELDYAKSVSQQSIIDILKVYDKESLKYVVNNDYFKENFYNNCKDNQISDLLCKL